MKNIIRINLDVNERNESNIGIPLPQKVIRSKDTAVIIEMRIIGYDVNDGYTFTLLSEYTKSKRHTLYELGDRLKIEGNVVTFVPPAELISTLEIVTNTLYIEKSGVSLDFSKFHYLAQLSEVDNTVGPVKEVYDDNYQSLIDELEFKYMLIEDLTAEYVAAQVAEARVGEDGTIYRFLKERLDVEYQKVTAQVGEVSNQLELTNNEIIDARGGKPTLRVRLNEIDRVDEYGKHWTLIDGEWEERVGQSQLINVHGEVAWAMAEAEQAREDAIKAYEDAVAEAKRAADIEDALIRTNIQQGLSAVETEMATAKQEAIDATNQALEDAKAHADAEVQASKEHFDGLIEEVESEVADAQATADSAVNQIDTAVANAGFTSLDDTIQNVRGIASGVKSELDIAIENAGFTSLDETISSVQSISNQAQINASTAIDNAQDAMSSASTAISDASQAKADAQAAITEAGEAVDSANTAKTNAQTALENSNTAVTNAADAITKAGQAEDTANTAKTNAQTAIDDAQSALTEAGNAKTTSDTLSIKVDDLEGEVELKASQTEVDGISGTVSTHTTTLSQHATAISSKAESELVDTIKGTVDTHTTEISQNATDIASKANTTTVNTLTGRVDTAESNISQNATAITQRVTTTTYNAGIANKENTVLKQTTAPTHVNGRLWLDTSVTPNILKRSNGTTWIKATPTTPGEVGAYSQSDGAGLAGRLTTAETNITQTATAITSKADKSTVDTLAGTVSTQGTSITQQADLIASKASQTEVDTVKGTVSGHTTTLSQHADQIASKAETNLVNAIKGTVDNHTTEISQNATDIASKASSSSVNTLTGRVSTAETTISQHATEITSKANQEEVDTVKGTVSGHTTTLSQHASQIASKAESNLVNNIKGTVDTHTTEISQNATDIASKASSSSVNALTGRVSTAETGISANAEAIKLKANQSTVDTLAGTVSTLGSEFDVVAGQVSSRVWNTDIELAIDDIEIGGRNLVLNSLGRFVSSNYLMKFWQLSRQPVAGETYTFSAENAVHQGSSGKYIKYYLVKLDDPEMGHGWRNSVPILDYSRYYYKDYVEETITIPDSTVVDATWVLMAYLYPNVPRETTDDASVYWVKLEKGNIATDYTQAPEDTLNYIDHIESEWTQTFDTFSQTVSGIDDRVTTQKQTLDTISSTVSGHGGRLSTVEQTASGLQTTVADKANQSQVTQLANGLSSVVTDFNNLEIGGRNLFLGTKEFKTGGLGDFVEPIDGFNVMYMDNAAGTSEAQAFAYNFQYERDTEYVISFWVKGSGQTRFVVSGYNYPITTVSFEGAVGTDGGGSVLFDTPNDWKRVWVKIKTSSNWTVEKIKKITRVNLPAGNEFYIYGFKIEKGNKATDWTPAPEDIDGRVTAQKQTLDTISSTVSGHGGRISAVEQTASGLQSTVADKASQSQVTQLANGLSSVVTDFNNLEIGGRNLAHKGNLGVHYSGYSRSGDVFTVIGKNAGIRIMPDTFEANTSYVMSFKFRKVSGTVMNMAGHATGFAVERVLIDGNSTGNNWAGSGSNPVPNDTDTHTVEVYLHLGNNNQSGLYIQPNRNSYTYEYELELWDLQLEKGNKATDWTPAPEDVQSQISQLSNNINLRVSKGEVLSQINIEADRTLIQSNKLVLDANSVVFTGNAFIPSAQIVSVHADKINAGTISSARIDAKTIVTNGLAANVVSSNHIIANEALVDKVFSNQASVDRLWAKAIWTNKITAMEIDAGKITSGTINAARLNVTDLRSKILTANVIDATQINGSAAVFNKLFSTTSATSRLVAQGAWITNANVISLNADKITAGTISADRISTNSLSNLKVGGRNLQRNSTDFTQGWLERNDQNPVTFTITKVDDVYTQIRTMRTNSDSHRRFAYRLNQEKIEVGEEVTVSFDIVNNVNVEYNIHVNGLVDAETTGRMYHQVPANGHKKVISSGVRSTRFTAGFFEIYFEVGTIYANPNFNIGNLKVEKGNKATDWTPAPEDIVNDLGSSGNVEIHGGNIKADTLDVGAITGNLGEFINLSLKAQNSQASLSGASFRIESIANNQSYIEMSNAPEIRARSADSSMAVMGQGRTSYHYDGSERFYFGSKLNGWQNGMMIRKHHGWGIMRESDSSNGVPAKYYTVPAGYQRVAVIEALMRDPTVTEVPTGNETQFIINSNYLGRLNGYTNSTSSTIAYPWPTLRTGDLIKYAEEIPGNESGVQQVFDIWDDNNTTVSAFGVHVTFHGGYSGASDRNIKHDIKDTAVEALAHIESLTFKEFRYNQDNRYEPIGMIAQDSGILRVKSDKVESIDIQRSIMLSLKGLQELQDIVKRQAEEINEQAEEINEQAEEIKQLKEIINQ